MNGRINVNNVVSYEDEDTFIRNATVNNQILATNDVPNKNKEDIDGDKKGVIQDNDIEKLKEKYQVYQMFWGLQSYFSSENRSKYLVDQLNSKLRGM